MSFYNTYTPMIFEFKNKPFDMLHEFIRLIFGGVTGSFATIINLQQVTFPIQQTISLHMAILNGLLGLVIGSLTIVFLVYQIRKIKRELKIKKKQQ